MLSWYGFFDRQVSTRPGEAIPHTVTQCFVQEWGLLLVRCDRSEVCCWCVMTGERSALGAL